MSVQPRAYYNDIDPYACRVLAKQIKAGALPPGDVDDRDIRDVHPAELAGYTQIHLFAGIGGIPYGLRLAGVPDALNLITGGFPCQDISNAGQRAGIEGARSGLWGRYAELIRQLRPRYVLVENVAALLGRGAGRVLGDLAACGYDAEWDCIPASAVGAPHRRDRFWLVAYPQRERAERGRGPGAVAGSPGAGPGEPQQRQRLRDAALDRGSALAHADGERKQQSPGPLGEERGWIGDSGAPCRPGPMADADGQRCEEQHATPIAGPARQPGWRADAVDVSDPDGERRQQGQRPRPWAGGDDCRDGADGDENDHPAQPGMGGEADGLPGGLDRHWADAWGAGWEDGIPRTVGHAPDRRRRLHGLGNAVVPQVVAVIGLGILRHAGIGA